MRSAAVSITSRTSVWTRRRRSTRGTARGRSSTGGSARMRTIRSRCRPYGPRRRHRRSIRRHRLQAGNARTRQEEGSMKMLVARGLRMCAASALAFVIATAVAVVLAPAALHAQTTGAIRGVVTAEATSAPVEGAQVLVIRDPRVARTDPAGVFHLGGVAAGVHTVRVLSIGYAAKTMSGTVGGRENVHAKLA